MNYPVACRLAAISLRIAHSRLFSEISFFQAPTRWWFSCFLWVVSYFNHFLPSMSLDSMRFLQQMATQTATTQPDFLTKLFAGHFTLPIATVAEAIAKHFNSWPAEASWKEGLSILTVLFSRSFITRWSQCYGAAKPTPST